MNAFKLSALAALTATMGFPGGMGNAMADQQLVDQLSQLKLNVKCWITAPAKTAWIARRWAPIDLLQPGVVHPQQRRPRSTAKTGSSISTARARPCG